MSYRHHSRRALQAVLKDRSSQNLFAIVEKGKTEREVADALKSLKDQLTALKGGTPNVIEV